MKETIKCPVCDGKGEILKVTRFLFKAEMMDQRKGIAKKLKKSGLSHREIMTIMGYKSPRSISELLK